MVSEELIELVLAQGRAKNVNDVDQVVLRGDLCPIFRDGLLEPVVLLLKLHYACPGSLLLGPGGLGRRGLGLAPLPVDHLRMIGPEPLPSREPLMPGQDLLL